MNKRDREYYEMFLDGKMSKDELRLKLKDFSDQDFLDIVEGIDLLEDGNSFLNIMDGLENKIDARVQQAMESQPVEQKEASVKEEGENGGFPLRWLVAAAVIFLLGTLVLKTMNKAVTPEDLFATYYAPLEHPDPVVRSEGDNSLEDKAVAAYSAGNYELAVEYYEELSHRESWEIKNALFLGIAYISINSEQKAINTFNNLPRDLGQYKDEVTWYLALAHLKNNDLVSARLLLEKLSVDGNYYQNQAASILKKLE